MTRLKLFYSWQLDAPRKVNKDLIYSALSDAIQKLGEDLDLDEAERHAIELDQDTQGVLGSPDIARVIFEKIAKAQVVVADVSLVAEGSGRKRHINSNVAIELGYAYGKNGDNCILKVMNSHFGEPDGLPFDLRARRHPVQYSLAPDADKEAVSVVRKKLANQLAIILKQYLATTPVGPAHAETEFVGRRGVFWKPNEPLVPRDGNYRKNDFFCTASTNLYFRCIPERALPELNSREAHDLTGELWPLLSEGGYSRSRNKWGAISHCLSLSRDTLIGAAQVFKNREIWGVDCCYAEAVTRPEDEHEDPIRYIPAEAILLDYPRAIRSMRSLAATLGYGDRYTIEFGFSGAEGASILFESRFQEPFSGPFYDNDVYVRKSIAADYPIGQIMNDFWEKLFSEVGRSVPEKLVWKSEE